MSILEEKIQEFNEVAYYKFKKSLAPKVNIDEVAAHYAKEFGGYVVN